MQDDNRDAVLDDEGGVYDLPKCRDVLRLVLAADEDAAEGINDDHLRRELGSLQLFQQPKRPRRIQGDAVAGQRSEGNIISLKVQPKSEALDTPFQSARVHFFVDVEHTPGVRDSEPIEPCLTGCEMQRQVQRNPGLEGGPLAVEHRAVAARNDFLYVPFDGRQILPHDRGEGDEWQTSARLRFVIRRRRVAGAEDPLEDVRWHRAIEQRGIEDAETLTCIISVAASLAKPLGRLR